MTKTTTDLATAVLRRLRVIGSNETAEAEDDVFVKAVYANVYQELEYQDLAFWDETAIDERVFEALADVVAARSGANYGQSKPDLESAGMRRLNILAAEIPSGAVAKNEYF